VVKLMDVLGEGAPGEVSQDGHEKLEKAEMEGKSKNRPGESGLARGSNAQRNRKDVHGQSQGNQENGKEIHASNLRSRIGQ